MLTLQEIKEEIEKNELKLREALLASQFEDVNRLMTQRIVLKETLIEYYENLIKNVA